MEEYCVIYKRFTHVCITFLHNHHPRTGSYYINAQAVVVPR